MALTLQLKSTVGIPIEVEGITPDRLRELTLPEIERCEVFLGNQKMPLAELFSVDGSLDDERMEWQGSLEGVHWIGAKMRQGDIYAEGSVGRHLGSEMRGGQIHVQGSASDWVGGEMHGGKIHVRGRAGHLVGAAYRGSPVGMTGGTVLIEGDVGNEVGHTMRRGVIAVGGCAGDLIGFNMLAGSIFVCGDVGIRHGAGMRRGTIGLLGEEHPQLLPSFRYACRRFPEIFRVIARYLSDVGFPSADRLLDGICEFYNGDLIEGGRGEILIRA